MQSPNYSSANLSAVVYYFLAVSPLSHKRNELNPIFWILCATIILKKRLSIFVDGNNNVLRPAEKRLVF